MKNVTSNMRYDSISAILLSSKLCAPKKILIRKKSFKAEIIGDIITKLAAVDCYLLEDIQNKGPKKGDTREI